MTERSILLDSSLVLRLRRGSSRENQSIPAGKTSPAAPGQASPGIDRARGRGLQPGRATVPAADDCRALTISTYQIVVTRKTFLKDFVSQISQTRSPSKNVMTPSSLTLSTGPNRLAASAAVVRAPSTTPVL